MNLARQAIKAWPRHETASRQQINHLRREWIKKIELLGNRWLLARANYVEKRS